MDLDPKTGRAFFKSLIPELIESKEYHESLVRIYKPLVKELEKEIGKEATQETPLYSLFRFHYLTVGAMEVLIWEYQKLS